MRNSGVCAWPDAHGAGIWNMPMTKAREGCINEWLGKTQLHGHGRGRASRHTFGADLQPVTYGTYARRETDVRDCLPGCTLRVPEAVFPLSCEIARKMSNIHGDTARVSLQDVVYGEGSERIHPQAISCEATSAAAASSCFFCGENSKPSSNQSSSDWRRGDVRGFVIGDTAAPVPPGHTETTKVAAHGRRKGGKHGLQQSQQDEQQGEQQLLLQFPQRSYQNGQPYQEGDAESSILARVARGESLAARCRPSRVGMKLTDIHDGWNGLHRVDPPPPDSRAVRCTRRLEHLGCIHARARMYFHQPHPF